MTYKIYYIHFNLSKYDKEMYWILHLELKPNWKKVKDNNSKKKEKVIFNAIEVEEQSKLKQLDFKLSMIVRKPEIAIKAYLEVREKLFCLKIQMKLNTIKVIVEAKS